MRSKTGLAAAALVATVTMVFPTAALGVTRTVTAQTDSWGPARSEIRRGDRVRWENPANSGRIHTLISYGGNWSKNVRLLPGDSTSRRFRRVGSYRFRCREHSTKYQGQPCTGMCGVVRVTRR